MIDRRDLFVSASDALKLYACDAGPQAGPALPVVCLPGLARTSADFEDLIEVLAGDPHRPRRVLALDYRGRGRSDWDPDPRRYDVRVELDDVLSVLTAAGIEEAVFVGTSRGGIITMGIGAARPALLRGAVLNDIGPAIEARGLLRIRGYVGKLPAPRDLADAAEILRQMSAAQFPAFADEDWLTMARTTWREHEGRLVLAYDPALMKTLESLDAETAIPPLWNLFEPLKRIPVLVLRGEHSDILSAATVDAMRAAHPRLEAVTVPGQGHAPLLRGALTERIRRFVEETERAERLPAGEIPSPA